MNDEDFKKTIQFEDLAVTRDYWKFLLKSYLDIKLKSGAREICRIYAVGRVSNKANREDSDVKKLEIKMRTQALLEFFNNIKKDGYWKNATSKAEYYYDGKEVFEEKHEFEPKEYDTKVVTTTETTYMMHKDLDIKPKIIMIDRK